MKVVFDSKLVSYKELLNKYWVNIDPFDNQGQFCDRGNSYKPIIFVSSESQRIEAKESKERFALYLNILSDKFKVEIKDLNKFWIAEQYHQDFAERNPIKYNFYRLSCGRDNRLKEVWGET